MSTLDDDANFFGQFGEEALNSAIEAIDDATCEATGKRLSQLQKGRTRETLIHAFNEVHKARDIGTRDRTTTATIVTALDLKISDPDVAEEFEGEVRRAVLTSFANSAEAWVALLDGELQRRREARKREEG
jgi:hypothetical protein